MNDFRTELMLWCINVTILLKNKSKYYLTKNNNYL